MKYLMFLITLVLFTSCGATNKKTSLDFYPVSKESFSKFINKKDIRSQQAEDVEYRKDIHLINNEYPIEISLYENGEWFYNLENLGKGKGTWIFKNGRLELFAERILFDMYIDIESADSMTNNLIIKFSDRHGPNVLKVENRNLEK